MKTTIRFCCALLFLALSVSLFAQEKAVPKDMFGKWDFKLENPETGEVYSGVCTISQKGKEAIALFDLGAGSGVETKALRPNDNGKFYTEMVVEGYSLGVSFDYKAPKLMCELDAGSFAFPLDMSKAE